MSVNTAVLATPSAIFTASAQPGTVTTSALASLNAARQPDTRAALPKAALRSDRQAALPTQQPAQPQADQSQARLQADCEARLAAARASIVAAEPAHEAELCEQSRSVYGGFTDHRLCAAVSPSVFSFLRSASCPNRRALLVWHQWQHRKLSCVSRAGQ